MKKMLIIIFCVLFLSGCSEILQTTPYKHLKRGTDKLDSWDVEYDEINIGVSDEQSNHDSTNKRIFINLEEENIHANVIINYWDGPKNFISVTSIVIKYFDKDQSIYVSISANPNVLTIDWEELYDELYQPDMNAETLYETMQMLKIDDIQRLFLVNDIEY